MKKGMAPEIYLAITIIIIFMVLSTLIVSIFSPTIKRDVEETKNTYVLVNALKSAKLYMESSLDFSVYQSSYNNSRYGGYYDISPPIETITNELLPLCEKHMEKYKGCDQSTPDRDKKIHTGLKYEGTEFYNTYPAGLLQCILSRLRREYNGEVYYGLRQDEIKQLDCDFGEITDKGLKGFQKDHELDETGILNHDTLEKLKEVFSMKWGDCSKFFDDCEDNIRSMVVWKDAGPDEQTILNELKKSIKEKMGKYTEDQYVFMGEYLYLPTYEENDITLYKGDSSLLKIELRNEDSISVTKEDRTILERINMQISPEISKEYSIRYLNLYETAKETFNELENFNCEDYIPGDKLKHKEKKSGFLIDAEVWEKEDLPCELIVKVSVTDTTKTFPVFNGNEVSFESIGFVFLAKVQ